MCMYVRVNVHGIAATKIRTCKEDTYRGGTLHLSPHHRDFRQNRACEFVA